MQMPDLLGLFIAPLEASGIDYMVTGSMASIIYGQPRLTNDVDLVLKLRRDDVDRLPSVFFEDPYYCPPHVLIKTEVVRRQRGHFNVIHLDSGFKADCYLMGREELHWWAMERRRRLPMPPLEGLWVAPPEYVILRKLEFYREGSSHKHIDDIVGMLLTSGEIIDIAVLEELIETHRLGIEWDLVQAALTRTP